MLAVGERPQSPSTCLPSVVAVFLLREQPKGQRRSCNAFYILASYIRHCPFHRILSVRVNPCLVLEEATQGHKAQEMRLTGAILEASNHHPSTHLAIPLSSAHPFNQSNICRVSVRAKAWKQHTYTPKPTQNPQKRGSLRRKPLWNISLQFFFFNILKQLY